MRSPRRVRRPALRRRSKLDTSGYTADEVVDGIKSYLTFTTGQLPPAVHAVPRVSYVAIIVELPKEQLKLQKDLEKLLPKGFALTVREIPG